MGNTNYTSKGDKRDSYLFNVIERKWLQKNSTLQKKIHNEYLEIIGIKEMKLDYRKVNKEVNLE